MTQTEAAETDDHFQTRLSVFYIAIFSTIGCYLPYFPLWLDRQGLTPGDVAIILATPMIVRVFFAPLISFWADYEGNYRKILLILAIGSLFAVSCYFWVRGFYLILLIAGLNAIFWSAIIPLTETMAMSASRARKLHYGRARSWGSFSFIVASFSVGLLVDQFSGAIVHYVLIATALFIVCAAFYLPPPIGKGRLRRAVAKGRFSMPALKVLLSNPLFWIFLSSVGLSQAAHAFYYGFSTIHWRDMGMSGGLIGTLWSLGVIAEIVLFVVGGAWLKARNPVLLLAIGALAGALRWGISAMDPAALWIWIPLQLLHAFSFGLVHLGAMFFISEVIDPSLGGTAQGLLATFAAGIIMGVLVMVSGPLYETIGVLGYLVMMVCSLASCALSFYFYKVWDGKSWAEALRQEDLPNPA